VQLNDDTPLDDEFSHLLVKSFDGAYALLRDLPNQKTPLVQIGYSALDYAVGAVVTAITDQFDEITLANSALA
jgi:hypothetical protein